MSSEIKNIVNISYGERAKKSLNFHVKICRDFYFRLFSDPEQSPLNAAMSDEELTSGVSSVLESKCEISGTVKTGFLTI